VDAAGLMGVDDSIFKYRGAYKDNLNDCIQNGSYKINKVAYPETSNIPGSSVYGILVVFTTDYWHFQIFSNLGTEVYLRTRSDNGVWGSWNKVEYA